MKLESLEDAVVLEDYADDLLSDKHGCPAYVSPEILRTNTRYSGRAADMWGLGVMLYTMLVGRLVRNLILKHKKYIKTKNTNPQLFQSNISLAGTPSMAPSTAGCLPRSGAATSPCPTPSPRAPSA